MITVLLTVLSGVTVYVLGQLSLKLLIEPVHEFKKTVGEVAHNLLFYDNVYGCGDRDKMQEASVQLRKLSAQLSSHIYLMNGMTSWIFRVPDRARIYDAMKDLIGLSNSVWGSGGDQSAAAREKREQTIEARVRRISDALGIHDFLTESPK